MAAPIAVSFPLYCVAPVHYWQEIAPRRQRFNVDVLLAALWEMLDDALRAC